MTGGIVYRSGDIKQLANLVLFGELVSGEIFYIPADDLPQADRRPFAAFCSTTTANQRRSCSS